MARQRFIYPEMWHDRRFGTLDSDEKLLFIALFSLADDEGRLQASPMLLRSAAFPYEDWSADKVEAIRDSVAQKMRSVHLYEVDEEHFVQLLTWDEHQKPKYKKDSRFPPPPGLIPPPPDQSGTGLEPIGPGPGPDRDRTGSMGSGSNSSSGSGVVRAGVRVVEPPALKPILENPVENSGGEVGQDFKPLDPVHRLLAVLPDADDGNGRHPNTERQIRKLVLRYQLGEGDLEEAREAALSDSAKSPTAVAISILKRRGESKAQLKEATG